MTFVSCRKDGVPEPPAPVNFSTLAFQDEYIGTENFKHYYSGYLIEDTTYNRTYKFFAMEPDPKLRYLEFYQGVIDTIEIPLNFLATGYFKYQQSGGFCPEYGYGLNQYSTRFEVELKADSIYFLLIDDTGSDVAFRYSFSGVKN
jgi:hypothetical protein